MKLPKINETWSIDGKRKKLTGVLHDWTDDCMYLQGIDINDPSSVKEVNRVHKITYQDFVDEKSSLIKIEA
jgi:hypothetical protein